MSHLVLLAADITDAFVVVLLIGGMILAIGRSARIWLAGRRDTSRQGFHAATKELRLDLGQLLLLALEILIISDILHSIVKRTIEEVSILAITVVIRISLSFFLERELSELGKEPKDGPQASGDSEA
jgi:uncharacterized membrane protein